MAFKGAAWLPRLARLAVSTCVVLCAGLGTINHSCVTCFEVDYDAENSVDNMEYHDLVMLSRGPEGNAPRHTPRTRTRTRRCKLPPCSPVLPLLARSFLGPRCRRAGHLHLPCAANRPTCLIG